MQLLDECMQPFEQSGQVLQDVVNEVGRRLDFSVENGLYQGRRGEVGFDGLWTLTSGYALVVEVKTTDVYTMSLDTIADYREKLAEVGRIGKDSSILIIVGRQDTGSLEAQIRGSRHAWDIRMVSVDGLKKLLRVKEQGEDATARKIPELLVPFEYTRVDRIIDIVFTTATDVQDIGEDLVTDDEKEPSTRTVTKYEFTPSEIVEALKRRLIKTFETQNDCGLVKKTRSQYWNPATEKGHRFVCTISKTYPDGGYWYAYHPAWDQFLQEGEPRILALGMVGRDDALFIPRDFFADQLDNLGMTQTGEGGYWHVVIRNIDNKPHLIRKAGVQPLPLDSFIVLISS